MRKIWSRKILAITAMGTLVCLLTGGQAAAFNEDDLDRLLEHNECPECDLSGAQLNFTRLAWADLIKADLSGANLTRTDLSRALLIGTRLSGANLTRASLFGARLVGAELSGANLNHADLSEANLNLADLSGANLSGANLSGAHLSWAIWTDGRKCVEGSIGECR
ncbi:MAG: pentapeptide repeat-containing protein [Desulfonatronovibrio sp.]